MILSFKNKCETSKVKRETSHICRFTSHDKNNMNSEPLKITQYFLNFFLYQTDHDSLLGDFVDRRRYPENHFIYAGKPGKVLPKLSIRIQIL